MTRGSVWPPSGAPARLAHLRTLHHHHLVGLNFACMAAWYIAPKGKLVIAARPATRLLIGRYHAVTLSREAQTSGAWPVSGWRRLAISIGEEATQIAAGAGVQMSARQSRRGDWQPAQNSFRYAGFDFNVDQ